MKTRLRLFKQETLISSDAKGNLTDPKYIETE
jgi:hypothetical protein